MLKRKLRFVIPPLVLILVLGVAFSIYNLQITESYPTSDDAFKVSPENIIPILNEKLGVTFKENKDNEKNDSKILQEYESENKDHQVSLYFFDEANSLYASTYLKSQSEHSTTLNCKNFAVVIKSNNDDISIVYKELTSKYFDCDSGALPGDRDGGKKIYIFNNTVTK